MPKITEENWLPETLSWLYILQNMFIDGVVPSLNYDGEDKEAVEDIDRLIKYLNK